MIEQNYRIDMIPDGAPVVVHISQYDTTARRLSFELYNGGVAYEIPTGAVASIAGTKPDGNAFLYAMTVEGNVASIDVEQQMALVAGDIPTEIQLTGDGGKIGSANFIIRVERGPIDEDSVISETDLPIFEELVSDAQAAAADAQTAADTASTAAKSISEILPASAGTTGQILTKTATGADWGNPNATEIETFGGVGTAIKMASGNPVTIADALQGKALGVNTTLEPIQDLHGYDHPWAGGAGKNLLPMTVDWIKAENTTGSWNGNVCTYCGCTYEILTDDASNVIGIKVNGTSTANATFWLGMIDYVANTNMSINSGVQTETSEVFFRMSGWGKQKYTVSASSSGNDKSFSFGTDGELWGNIRIGEGKQVTNMIFRPYLFLDSNPMTSFEPYSNICPISGRTSVDVLRREFNQWDEEWESGYVDVNTGEPKPNNTQIRSKNYISVLPEKVYWCKSPSPTYMVFYDASNNYVTGIRSSQSNKLFATPSDARYMKFYCAGTSYNHDICINISDPAKNGTYEPYAGQSVTVQLGQTVYGGKLNVTTGKLTVETANIASYNGESIGEPWWSSMDEYVAGATPSIGAQVVYTLATPTTVSLTPAQIQLLTGTNVISTNADDLSVRYYASGKGTVEGSLVYLSDKKANTSTLATVESTSTASKAYTVGSYLVYNGILYRVTAAISAGHTLTPGTNISATNAGAELTSLNNGLTSVTTTQLSTTKIVCTCYKWERICMLSILSGDDGTTAANTVLATLPKGYRPLSQVEFVDSYGKIRIRITDNGQITNIEQSTTFIRGTCVFIVP